MENENPEHPPVEPSKPENLALHFGRMEAEHQEMRREHAEVKAEMQSLREAFQELQQALLTVEAEAEAIAEQHPEEASLDDEGDHRVVESSETKQPHWLARLATGV